MAPSDSPYLLYAANTFASIFICYGTIALFRPRSALSFFKFDAPASAADKKVVDGLLVLYGARAVFMGVTIITLAYLGQRQALGCILVAASAVAAVDGEVCRYYGGKGQWDHWGYAPVLTAVGAVLLGAMDG